MKSTLKTLGYTFFFVGSLGMWSPLTMPDSSSKNDLFAFNDGENSLVKLFHPNYILPAYYTDSPDDAVYQGNTPDNQKVKSLETKFQISLLVPLTSFGSDRYQLNAAYTQQSYWQTYNDSQFFRENNYQPELFLSSRLSPCWMLDMGIAHQSNGRGGSLERSWNRLYAKATYNEGHFFASIKPWALVFKSSSSDLHNKDIASYLGYGELVAGYKLDHHIFTLTGRSINHPTTWLTWSFPLFGTVRGFVEAFSGYGQSLIEYNHYTNSIGIGISFNTEFLD